MELSLGVCDDFVVPGLFWIGLPFLPKSPVWYLKKKRGNDARQAIVRLFGKDVDVEGRVIKSELEMMNGEAHNASQTSWRQSFSRNAVQEHWLQFLASNPRVLWWLLRKRVTSFEMHI